ncbi:MAG: type IV secretion system DNA-binding domain-containing protein [bacterium]|nr:type IV secretion system DNA-binding domain-containing protein [bacterium]
MLQLIYAAQAQAGNLENDYVTVFPWAPLIIAVGVVLAIVVVFLLVRRRRAKPSTIKLVCLMVTLPKEQQEEDSGKGSSRIQQMQEQISVGESFLSFLGNMRAQRWYHTLGRGRNDHFSLEIVADRELITFYVVVPEPMKEFMEQQIQAQYADAEILVTPEYNPFRPTSHVAAAALSLRQRSLFPILSYRRMDVDPLSGLTNALSKLSADESAVIQYVCRSSHPRWHTRAAAAIRNLRAGGKANPSMVGKIISELWSMFFSTKKSSQQEEMPKPVSPVQEELIQRLQEKNTKPALDVNIRIVVSSATQQLAATRLQNIMSAFGQYASPETGNRFWKNAWHSNDTIIRNFIYRMFDGNRLTLRPRYATLSTEELASLWHLPLATTETPNIRWVLSRNAPPPVNLPKTGVLLGTSHYRGEEAKIRVAREDRRRHVYVIGKSGVGKSVLMTQMALQDIANGDGVCVVDPHGDLIIDIMGRMPAHRLKDVIHFNPSDMQAPVGLNMLDAENPEDKDFAVQEMISIFMKLFPPEMIGPMFEHNMRNVMLTLMADPENPGTIVEIPRMFTDPVFQKLKVSKVTDPIVRAFWEKEMAKTSDFHKSEMLGYLISKVGRFVENTMMRNVIGQSKSGFDFQRIMNEGKILLVNLSKGTTGEVNANLLGLIIVSKLQMAALRRASLPQEQRKDFFLYIDEFQNFITDSIATILSEARKYRLNLTIAHQYVGQLVQGADTKIRDAVFGNVGTVVAFRVGVEDAETFAQTFAPTFSAFDVTNVEKYTAIVKLLIDNTMSKPFTMKTLPLVQPTPGLVEHLVQLSRKQFGVPRETVEKEILERSQLGAAAPPPMVAERKA